MEMSLYPASERVPPGDDSPHCSAGCSGSLTTTSKWLKQVKGIRVLIKSKVFEDYTWFLQVIQISWGGFPFLQFPVASLGKLPLLFWLNLLIYKYLASPLCSFISILGQWWHWTISTAAWPLDGGKSPAPRKYKLPRKSTSVKLNCKSKNHSDEFYLSTVSYQLDASGFPFQ